MGKTRIIGLLFIVLLSTGSLSGCVLLAVGAAGANYATKDIECDAIRSDRERGVTDTTAWMPSKCPELFPVKTVN
jgi:hypothetical protein